MDVALGVAVTDRVARLALVDSAAPGTVIDQFVLDVAEHPVEVLTETVVGTDRSLAGENHRLVATRLCWPDQAKADELQHALQDSIPPARHHRARGRCRRVESSGSRRTPRRPAPAADRGR